ncbi:hypothetical protein RRG08_026732 [Elysia crispata]|uniref:Calcineurin-like phosphoesterase domain-containing protein n=1 Tax=Elysia crispata TaxID=231223 RepID=A0AAE1AQ27_9GAST|nr:hypothetical protein RRG08_026732 [Elysia crispata]
MWADYASHCSRDIGKNCESSDKGCDFARRICSWNGDNSWPNPPAVRHVKIPVKDLPTNLEGLSFVQISDIHLGPTVGFTKLNMIVDIVNRQNPGDLVDGRVESLKRAAEPLSRVMSKYGNFFVTGNHEYYTGDVDNWFSYLRSLGFSVLHNSNVKIPLKVNSNEGQLCLAGTDDVQADTIE